MGRLFRVSHPTEFRLLRPPASSRACEEWGQHAVRTIHHHFGIKVINPTTALATTRSAGLILYRIRISSTATAMAAVSVPVTAPLAMLKHPASNKPIDTGASPR